jgi:hypothetical protein
MKTSLVLRPRRPLDRSEAWGCFTANIALPGSGSLVAGRPIGYAQLACALAGLGITCVAGLRFIAWYFKNQAQLSAQTDDPFGNLGALWSAAQWPLIGMAVFIFAVLWAMTTSIHILSTNQKTPATPPRLPPRLPEN